MAVVDTRVSVWEALAGRAPGQPVGPADPGIWAAVTERINPARARPVLRAGIETAELTSVRGVPYVMLRSPDQRRPCYLRLTPEEAQLAGLMDGTRTLARLVADFARICGRLAPDQVRRVVADLAGNRMLEELPLDAFAPLRRVHRRPWPLRLGRAILAVAQGRRVAVANVDPIVTVLYRAGGRLLFTRPVAALLAVVALLGVAAFGWQWWTGEQSVFLSDNSYAAGAALLLGLNVMALASHELGHALATKHAGRRVPNAGFLIYFGIPSVFVDTTDVWMAGRRARLVTTIAGPAAGLVLAGTSSLVGLFVPALASVCFKLSFAWYLNALFNLNPFLALDGYYLIMDWLEIPNLRSRGLAWVGARLRRRPPRWAELDREGRLVGLYGLLAVGWVLVALNIAYRLYVDRVDGLVVGLWRSGIAAQLLLTAVVLALASPIVYIVVGWLVQRTQGLRRGRAERAVTRDEPHRLAALRDSALGDLPEPALRALAAAARWRHPRTGELLVLAGGAQREVFAVVEGALEARAPGDPVGTVRERVGAGGVVGLAAALRGSPSALAWHTAGTTLLQIPAATVAATVGPIAASAGIGFGTENEAEQLFAEAPALAGLSTEDRLGLAAVAVPVSLAPGAPVTLPGGDAAVIVAAGTVVLPEGDELGRGTMIGPVGEEHHGPVATARTPVRLFTVPAVAGLPLLLGVSAGVLATDMASRDPGRAPVSGVHPPAAYPPLAIPPGPPPPSTADDGVDGRFQRRLWWLLLLVLLLVLLLTGGNVVLAAQGWAEMPTDRALLRVEAGTVAVDGLVLTRGEELYVGEHDSLTVDARSRALLTFRGGGTSRLCARTELTIGPLSSDPTRPVAPHGAFSLTTGRAIVDTATTSPAFTDLALVVGIRGATVRNAGAALFAVTSSGATVTSGEVFVGTARQPPTGKALGCGDEAGSLPVVTDTTSPPVPTVTPTPSVTPDPSVSPTPVPTTPPATTGGPTTPPASPVSPTISWAPNGGDPGRQVIAQRVDYWACDGKSPLSVSATIRDGGAGGPDRVTRVEWSWTGFVSDSRSQTQPYSGPDWMVSVGNIPYEGKPNDGGTFTVTARAFDAQGDATTLTSGPVRVSGCSLPYIQWVTNPYGQVSQRLASGGPCVAGVPTTRDASVIASGSGIERVVLTWSGFASGSVDMKPAWQTAVGPFAYLGPSAGGTVMVSATAYDSRGRPGNTLSTIVTVLKCGSSSSR